MRQGRESHAEKGPRHAPGLQRPRRSNWRTALVLLSVALVFFIGVIANRLLYS
jgi:hypothetical protein